MSQDPYQRPAGTGEADDLQFERAEPAPPPAGVGEPVATSASAPPAAPPGITVCAACHRPISNMYFEARGKVVCPRCRDAVESAASASGGAFVKALLYGIIAGAAGAAIWYAVRRYWNLQHGIVALAVGLMVGGAVRTGSGRRGGTSYQLLAVVLTYLAIAGNYLPDLLAIGFSRNDPPLLVVVNAVIGALLQPFLRGMSGVIGMIIIAFALWEAWRMNASPQIVFNGPYHLAPAHVAPPPMSPSIRA